MSHRKHTTMRGMPKIIGYKVLVRKKFSNDWMPGIKHRTRTKCEDYIKELKTHVKERYFVKLMAVRAITGDEPIYEIAI